MTKELPVGSHLFFVWVFWLSPKCSVTKGNEDYCRTLEFTPPINGYALDNHVVKNRSLERQDTCQIACYLKNECLSYNFGHFKDGSFICQLSDSDNKQYPQDLDRREGFIFQGTKSACSSYSCSSYDECAIDTDNKKSCGCLQGFARKDGAPEQWTKINIDAVCFGVRGDTYGTFKIQKSGHIQTFKLVHKNGSLRCNPREPPSFWGCTHSNYGDRRLLTVITHDNQAIPSLTDYFERGHVDDCRYYSYRLSNTDVNSTELIFNKLSTPLSVSTGQEFRIWYLQDWKKCYEDDNSGQTCADVYVWYTQN